MLTHRTSDGDLSACGLRIPTEYLTSVMGNVTCRSCNRENTRNYQPKARTSGYGDSNFPGTGALSCFHCGRPIREHPVARVCPFPPAMLT
jgi:hypothetical protein